MEQMSPDQKKMFRAVGYGMDARCVALKELLAAGVDPNAVCFPAHGFTPLHCVVSHDAQIASAAMRCLIAAGADVNIRDGEGETPVMSAAAMGIPGAIVFLAQHGADLTLRNSKGKSAYDIAKDPYEGSPECTEVLVELGFDPAAHPPPAIPIPAPSRVEMAVSSNGAAKGRIAFVGVDSSIYDAREVNPEIASFYNGHDAHKLQTMEWSEGCDIFEAMPGSGQLDPDRYTTVVTSEHLVSENSAVLQEYYRGGGRVIVFATNGVLRFASDVLSPLFDVDWKFCSYTRHTFQLTELGRQFLGEAADDGVPYTKSNCLVVPEGESILLPEHHFEASYGYALGDVTSGHYDPGDAQRWAAQTRDLDTPIAFHADSTHGGELVYIGVLNIPCIVQVSLIVEKLIRSPPRLETRGGADDSGHGDASAAVAAASARAKEEALCVICMDAPATFLITPCGHQCGCEECLKAIQQNGGGCPICRKPIESLQKVYIAAHMEKISPTQGGSDVPGPANTKGPWKCSACGVACGRAGFSKSQQAKGRGKCRCKTCISNGVPARF